MTMTDTTSGIATGDIGPDDIMGQMDDEAKTGTEACPQCSFVAKNHTGLVAHIRTRHSPAAIEARVDRSRGGIPGSDAKKDKGSTTQRPDMDKTVAWIRDNVQPGILRSATFVGIPPQLLAEFVLEDGVPVWEPKRPTSIGKGILLDDMTINVYAAAYVYGQDTWLANTLMEWGQKALPLLLVVGVSVVTLAHVKKCVDWKDHLEENVSKWIAANMTPEQQEAMRKAMAEAEEQAAQAAAAA